MNAGRMLNPTYRERKRGHLPPEELVRGVEQFNTGKFPQCCSTLEFISLHEPRLERNLYQGIIQLAIALSNWQEGDYRGALRQLRTGKELLQHVTPVCQNVDVADLIRQTEELREELEALGMERMHEVSRSKIPQIRIIQ